MICRPRLSHSKQLQIILNNECILKSLQFLFANYSQTKRESKFLEVFDMNYLPDLLESILEEVANILLWLQSSSNMLLRGWKLWIQDAWLWPKLRVHEKQCFKEVFQ